MLPSQSQHDSFAWETSLDIQTSEDRRRPRVKSVYERLVEKLSLRPLRQTLSFYIKMLPCTKPAPYRDAFPSAVRMNLTGPHGALNPPHPTLLGRTQAPAVSQILSPNISAGPQ